MTVNTEAEQLPTYIIVHFADDIGGLVGKEEELAYVVDHLDKIFAAMEVSAENTKLMTNNTNGMSIDIRINGKTIDGFPAITPQQVISCWASDKGKYWNNFPNLTYSLWIQPLLVCDTSNISVFKLIWLEKVTYQ